MGYPRIPADAPIDRRVHEEACSDQTWRHLTSPPWDDPDRRGAKWPISIELDGDYPDTTVIVTMGYLYRRSPRQHRYPIWKAYTDHGLPADGSIRPQNCSAPTSHFGSWRARSIQHASDFRRLGSTVAARSMRKLGRHRCAKLRRSDRDDRCQSVSWSTRWMQSFAWCGSPSIPAGLNRTADQQWPDVVTPYVTPESLWSVVVRTQRHASCAGLQLRCTRCRA